MHCRSCDAVLEWLTKSLTREKKGVVMKRRVALCAILLGFAAGFSHADGLVGRQIAVEVSDHVVLNPIISLPYDGPKAEGRLVAVEDQTGKKCPLTVADGAVYFVPEGALPNTKHVYP